MAKPYYELDQVMRELPKGTTIDENVLEDWGKESDKEIDDMLRPYVTPLPLSEPYPDTVKNASSCLVIAKWYRKGRNLPMFEAYFNSATAMMDRYIKGLQLSGTADTSAGKFSKTTGVQSVDDE